MQPIIGQIILFAGNFTPKGWMPCAGQLLEIRNHTALFSLLGTSYGGDGRVHFALPDLRGRVPIGVGASIPSQTTNYQLGQRGGQEMVTLSGSQLPSHSHRVNTVVTATSKFDCTDSSGTTDNPQEKYLGASAGGNNTYSGSLSNPVSLAPGATNLEIELRADTEHTGSSQAHTNMAPFLGVNFIICVNGNML